MKYTKFWTPPAWLEPSFIFMAFFVAATAAMALVLWFLVTFVVPFNLYTKQTDSIILNNGQTLQVEYPNLVLVENTPAYITFILHGESNAVVPASFTIQIPVGLTVVEPSAQAHANSLTITAFGLGSATKPDQIKIGVTNSHSMNSLLLFVRRPLIINSNLFLSAQKIQIGIETIRWVSAREIVKNTINEKSTLILLVTGFLSGAGALILQYTKTYRDRLREDRQKKEERFYKLLQQDFEGVISAFLRTGNGSRLQDDDFIMYKTLVEQFNWYHKLSANIRENLKRKEFTEARRRVKNLKELSKLVSELQDEEKNEIQILYDLCELASIYDRKNKTLSLQEVGILKSAYRRWNDLASIITDLIQDFSSSPGNYFLLRDVFQQDKDGKKVLQNSNLQYVMGKWPQKKFDELGKEALEIAYSLHWRLSWSGMERNLSEKIQRWLSGHRCETPDAHTNLYLGSEYAELDYKLTEIAIQHPVFNQIHEPSPSIVFGAEGMGKTASALRSVKMCQNWANSGGRLPRVFPVYAPFEPGVSAKNFLVKKISHTLINFISDNPRRFLNAPSAQKTAMGRLMLHYAKNMDILRLNFFSSPFENFFSDTEQVLQYISNLGYSPANRMEKDEMLNLLYLALPDGFDHIYFFWDIQSCAPQADMIGQVKEIENLALPLSRQNIFIKIFCPLTAKYALKKLNGFHHLSDINWTESQLRELIETRIKMFDVLWERGVEDSVSLVVSAASSSPRLAIRLLIALFDYVDKHFQEGDKLSKYIFDEVVSTLQE